MTLGHIVNIVLGQFTGYLTHPDTQHEFAEFVYVVRGRYEAQVEGHETILNPWQAIYYPPGCEHRPRMRGSNLPLVYCLQWHWHDSEHTHPHKLIMNDADGRVQETLSWLWNLHSTGSPRSAQQDHLLDVVLQEIIDSSLPPDDSNTDPITRVHRYIHENIFSLWSMRDLLAIACMSEANLRRRFTERYGMPPVRLANELRRQRAIGLIRGTTLPLQDIAKQCNYSSAAHLSRIVKHSTGQSPRQLRADDSA